MPQAANVRAAVPALVATALAVVSGCGGARTRQGLTRAQFISSADAVCRHEQAKLSYIAALAGRLGLALTRPAVIRQQVAQSQLATARLESLPEPPADVGKIGRWLGARTVAATVAFDVGEAPAVGQRRALTDLLAELPRVRARARGLARGYGLGACGGVD